jgi:DNA-binding beta-propeller fold protein YncE
MGKGRHMNMKRVISCVSAALIAVAILPIGRSQRAVAQAPAAASHEVPKFEVDPAWPKIPNGWVMGQVSSAACDDQGNIWVLQRPSTVRPGQKTGPPVMVFDQAGNYIKGWGGPGDGYDWPQTEHGIFVDYKGFVWIGGSGNDDQILKFTKDGKFVMQIGHGGKKKTNQDTEDFWEPADVFVYPKTNELFVADGYRNKRVIVLDADTGAFKRMWGAFGNVPTDDAAPTGGGEGADAAGRGRGGRGPDPNRIPAKELDPKDQGPQQFNLVHGVKVSNDGLVYVSDRGGKRVQVFSIDGKYITQIWIDRWCETTGQGCGNGQTAASTAFSADPAQRFLYVASRSPARIWIYDRKTLEPLDSFGRPGVAPGEFYVLHHMTTDSKGNLYTSEVEDGKRIQKFVFKGLVRAPAAK